MERVLGVDQTYDVREQLRVIYEGLPLQEAQVIYDEIPEDQKHLYSITTSRSEDYCGDLNITLAAVRRIADRNKQTFVLSLEDGDYKASFGNYGDCAEYKGSNPAFVSCVATLKFLGKL